MLGVEGPEGARCTTACRGHAGWELLPASPAACPTVCRGTAGSRLTLLAHSLPKTGPRTPALARRRKEQPVRPPAEADWRPLGDFSSVPLAAEVETPWEEGPPKDPARALGWSSSAAVTLVASKGAAVASPSLFGLLGILISIWYGATRAQIPHAGFANPKCHLPLPAWAIFANFLSAWTSFLFEKQGSFSPCENSSTVIRQERLFFLISGSHLPTLNHELQPRWSLSGRLLVQDQSPWV